MTEYGSETYTPGALDYLRECSSDRLAAWRYDLLEFGGEGDHVYLLIGIQRTLNLAIIRQ